LTRSGIESRFALLIILPASSSQLVVLFAVALLDVALGKPPARACWLITHMHNVHTNATHRRIVSTSRSLPVISTLRVSALAPRTNRRRSGVGK
jgi:hypothetical protein